MATNVVYNYGSEAGTTNSKFKAWVGIRIAEISDTAYRLEYGHALYVSKGNFNGTIVAYTGTTNGSTNWSGSVSLNSTGWYADDGWINAGWYSQGQTLSLYAKGGYTGSSGAYVSSEVSGSYTVPTLYWTVSYNANGGLGAPSSQTKYRDKTLVLSSTIPTREGYSFVGWATSSTATSASYAAGGSYTSNAALTLYAVWSVSKTCTIAYDANGGENAPLIQTHIYDTTSTLSSEKPTRYGYTFLGWATSSAATVVEYDSSDSYTNNDFADGDTITLYAVWKKIPTCEIVYDTNGGAGNMVSQIHVYGTTSTISEERPTRDGFRFLGWSDKSYASKARYLVGGLYTNNNFTDGDVVTLYAVWRKIINVYIQIPKED